MTVKEFLQQVYLAHRAIDIKLEQINRLQSLATRVTTTLKAVPNGANSFDSRIENSVVMIQEKISALTKEISDLMTVNEKVTTAISHVDNSDERAILEYRYLCFFSWKEIARLLKFSLRQVFLLHNRALKNFSKGLQ